MDEIVKRLRENRILQERADYSKYSRDELIKLAKDGDQLALETLIKSHQGFIKKMTSKYFLSSGDQDDLEQVATIAFWTAIQDWDMTGDFEAYAGRRIKSRLSDEISKEEAGKAQINILANSIDDTINDDGEGGEQTLGDTIPSKGDSPEDAAIAKELLDVVEKYLEDEFTPEEREVINKSVEGYKTKEIAEVLGMPYKKVDNILYKIKYKLKEYLKNNSYRESKKMDKDIEFSDEEKKILESALNNIKIRENRKFRAARLKESYDNYTEEQIDAELHKISEEIEDIESALEWTKDEEEIQDLEDALEDIHTRLYALTDFVTEEQSDECERLMQSVVATKDSVYSNPMSDHNPYADRGVRRSDFY